MYMRAIKGYTAVRILLTTPKCTKWSDWFGIRRKIKLEQWRVLDHQLIQIFVRIEVPRLASYKNMEPPPARGSQSRNFRKSNEQNKVKFPRRLCNNPCTVYARFHFSRVKFIVDLYRLLFRWLGLSPEPEVVPCFY